MAFGSQGARVGGARRSDGSRELGVLTMTTTEWFTSLSASDRKAILVRLHELRSSLGTQPHCDLITHLTRRLDDDHQAAKEGGVRDNALRTVRNFLVGVQASVNMAI